MDIDHFFGIKTGSKLGTDKKSKKAQANERQLKLQLTALIQDIRARGKVTGDELRYLKRYTSHRGPLPTVTRMVRILKRLDEKRLTQLCNQIYPTMFDGIKLRRVLYSLNRPTGFTLTKQQRSGNKKIYQFLKNPDESTFGLYGYAGTGKTTLIAETVGMLLKQQLIRSVAFTAPTNKAVNVIKSKIRHQLVQLVKERCGIDDSSISINEQINQLEKVGTSIDFVTIHRLLDYQTDFSVSGDRVFVKGGKSRLSEYDLVVVDECSMIPIQIIMDLYEECEKQRKKGRYPKVIFVGDPAQLPPVNERVSIIFSTDPEDFRLEKHNNLFANDCYDEEGNYIGKPVMDSLQPRLDRLHDNIKVQPFHLLSSIVRAKDDQLIGLCTDIREWVTGVRPHPTPYNYRGKTVRLYRYQNEDKSKTKWLSAFVSQLHKNKTVESGGQVGIILTWTNYQCVMYNRVVREQLFGKKDLELFEEGEILMLNDFYNITETEDAGDDEEEKKKHRFYTSEQIRVHDLYQVNKKVPILKMKMSKSAQRIGGAVAIEAKLNNALNQINRLTKRKYRCWKLQVSRMSGAELNHWIYVPKVESMETLGNDREKAANVINNLRKFYQSSYKGTIDLIDNEVIKPLWRLWSESFVEMFADVNYGYCITVHKSQGSTYHDVYADLNDIFKNRNKNETKRCVYTAITRAANSTHLLI